MVVEDLAKVAQSLLTLLLAQMDCKRDHDHDDDDHHDHDNGYVDDHLCLHALISMKKPMIKAQIQRNPASKYKMFLFIGSGVR